MRHEWKFLWTLISAVVVVGSAAAQGVDKAGQPVVRQTVSIADAVNVALRNSPTIEARKAMVAAASARVGMARAMTRLQVSTSTFATTGNMPMILPGSEGVQPQNFTTTPDKSRLDQNVMAMYPLYTGGTLSGRVAGAKLAMEASAFDAAASELDVSLAVKTAYYLVLYDRHVILAYQRRLDEAKERVRIAQESYDAGKIAKYDLLRNQTEMAEAEQQLNNANRDEETALIDLKSAMGISQSSALTLTDSFASEPSNVPLAELEAAAFAHRPELAAARSRTGSAEAGIKAAMGAYKPQLYATAMLDGSTTRGEGSDSGYLIGVTAALPIFDGGRRKSSVQEASAMRDQMKADERDAVLTVNRQVAAADTAQRAAFRNVGLSKAAVEQSEEDYRVIRLRYESGKSINVEVLDALASLTRAQTNYAEALYNFNVARETLSRALGNK